MRHSEGCGQPGVGVALNRKSADPTRARRTTRAVEGRDGTAQDFETRS